MNYALINCNESTGEIWTNYWGASIFYFELEDDGTVLRQIQEFERRQYLKYDYDYLEDKYGKLSEIPIDLQDDSVVKISKELFEEKWSNRHYQLFPEIVMTESVVGGSPRIDNRRLTVGDVVSIVKGDNLEIALSDFELTLLEIRQALNYCAKLRCKKDMPTVFCHNCTLRVEQDGDEIDEEEEHWLNASVLLKKYF